MQALRVHGQPVVSQQQQFQYSKHAEVIRVAVLGNSGVGKTAFIKCFLFGVYDPYMQSSLSSDFMSRTVQVDDDEVVVQFWEVEPPAYNCLIVMYDVTSRQSFVGAQRHVEGYRAKLGAELPMLLIANKMDCDSKRQVMAYEGELLALSNGALFSETSCTEAINVRQSVTEFIESVLTCHHKISTE